MLLKWKLSIFLLIIVCYLQYFLWFGKNNVFDYQENNRIIANMQLSNSKLKMRNEQMFAEIADLYEGVEAIEERARSNLGMIKPHEHFYRIVVESSAKPE